MNVPTDGEAFILLLLSVIITGLGWWITGVNRKVERLIERMIRIEERAKRRDRQDGRFDQDDEDNGNGNGYLD